MQNNSGFSNLLPNATVVVKISSKGIQVKNILYLIIVYLFSSYSQGGDLECFMVMVGKHASEDGSILVAHNNDLTGEEPSFVQKIPRKIHPKGAVISFPTGLDIPQVGETYEWMVMQIADGYKSGDAVAINEYQVSIAGGVALGKDRNAKAKKADPLISNGVPGGIRYVSLQRCQTAKSCTQLLGHFYTKYGVSYPSGVAIADQEEVWYLESGGGRSWAAVRVPDDQYWAQGNGYRIGVIDPKSPRVMTSPGLLSFAKRKGLWDPNQGPFSFKKAFGGRMLTLPKYTHKNTRRVWRAMDLLSPSLKLETGLEQYPSSATPDKKISKRMLMTILRDHYKGTEFDPYLDDNNGRIEAPIATHRAVHSNVIQLKKGLPKEIGSIMWAGLSAPFATPYLPFYFGIDSIPFVYAQSADRKTSAFYLYKKISNLIVSDMERNELKAKLTWEQIEDEQLKKQASIEKRYLELDAKDPGLAKEWLSKYIKDLSDRVVSQAKDLLEIMLH